jgi:hypothetical protein
MDAFDELLDRIKTLKTSEEEYREMVNYIKVGDVAWKELQNDEATSYESSMVHWEIKHIDDDSVFCAVTFPRRVDGKKNYKDGIMMRSFKFKKIYEVFGYREIELKLEALDL